MPAPMEPFNRNFYQTFRPLPGGPSGAPQVFNIHGVTQQNVEIPNSSSASIWQKFPSIEEAGVAREPDVWLQRTGQLYGSLPRPTATVKPLSLVPGEGGDIPLVSDDSCSDYNMPFANERLGTIRLKTNPQEAQQRDQESWDGTKETEISPRSGKNLLRTPTRATGRTATDGKRTRPNAQ